MRCPFCAHEDSQVKDSRPSEDGAAIRRRRQCEGFGARFTTFERVHLKDEDGARRTVELEQLKREMVTGGEASERRPETPPERRGGNGQYPYRPRRTRDSGPEGGA